MKNQVFYNKENTTNVLLTKGRELIFHLREICNSMLKAYEDGKISAKNKSNIYLSRVV